MSTITAILVPDSDGTVHLPLPEDLRGGTVKVVATVTPVSGDSHHAPQLAGVPKGFGGLKGKIWIAPDFDAPLEDFREYME